MTGNPATAIQVMLARLTRDHPNLSTLDRNIIAAFERLMLGRPELTDGTTSVSNICTEAGVSRASYYRSPVAAAIKEILATPTVPRPETEQLKAEIAELKQTSRRTSTEHAAAVRDYRNTVASYANQIQIITLRNAELEDEIRRLLKTLEATSSGNVRVLHPRTTTLEHQPS